MVDRRHPGKRRLPVSLNDTTCTITDTASSTNNPPMMASAISCLVATATDADQAAERSAPMSPMKIEAGGALNQRRPRPAPITAPQNTASSPAPAHEMDLQIIAEYRVSDKVCRCTPKLNDAIITGHDGEDHQDHQSGSPRCPRRQ